MDRRRLAVHEGLTVPFSGGSSLEGNFSAPFGGISVDFAHMDQILDLHEDEYAHTFSL